MCLAIYVAPGRTVTESDLRNGFIGNNQGAGFCFARDGKITVYKGYFTFDKFLEAYNETRSKNLDYPFLIHFRTSTAGKINTENCHPFTGKYGAFVHNGVIAQLGNNEVSDTAEFAELIAEVPESRLGDLAKAFEQDVGGWNRIAWLSNGGKVYFSNMNDGHWKDGCWFSNKGYVSGTRDYGGRPVSSHPAWSRFEDYDENGD